MCCNSKYNEDDIFLIDKVIEPYNITQKTKFKYFINNENILNQVEYYKPEFAEINNKENNDIYNNCICHFLQKSKLYFMYYWRIIIRLCS